ncbi:chromate transporter, partial [Pseudomonas sp. BGM005]|nr:chromate transporter [Pseudomonas sp. BG5]
VPFPLIVLAAGITGFFGGRAGLAAFKIGGGHKAGSGLLLSDADSMLGEDIPAHARPNLAWSLRVSTVLLALWLIPVAAFYLVFGADSVFAE